VVRRLLSLDTTGMDNGTELSCRAEQRDLTGRLLFNSSAARLVLWEQPAPLPPAGGLRCGPEWYCGYEPLLYGLLVAAVIFLIATCGVYFFLVTRGTAYTAILQGSKPGGKEERETVYTKPARPVGLPNPTFVPQRPAAASSINNSFYSQVNKAEKQSGRAAAKQEAEKLSKESILSSSTNNTTETVKTSEIVSDTSVTTSYKDEHETLLNTTLQETPVVPTVTLTTPPDETINFSLNVTGDSMDATDLLDEETQPVPSYLITQEEILQYRNTQTTTEMEFMMNKYRKRRDSGDSSVSGDSFVPETELVRYPLHKYELRGAREIQRLGRTYSKVVRDHLTHNPRIAVSETEVEFEVARPVSRTGERSQCASPWPGTRPSSRLVLEERREHRESRRTEETHFN